MDATPPVPHAEPAPETTDLETAAGDFIVAVQEFARAAPVTTLAVCLGVGLTAGMLMARRR